MKRTPLRRRTPLAPGKPLARKTALRRSSIAANPLPKPARRDLYDQARAGVFVRSQGWCEFALPGCTGRAVHAHHRRRRRYDPLHTTLAAVCMSCHSGCHNNPARSYELGHLLHNIDVSGSDPWVPPTLTAGRVRRPVTPNPLTVADPPPNPTASTEDAA